MQVAESSSEICFLVHILDLPEFHSDQATFKLMKLYRAVIVVQ